MSNEANELNQSVQNTWRIIKDLLYQSLNSTEPLDDILAMRDEAQSRIENDYEPLIAPIKALQAELSKLTDPDSLREELAEDGNEE